MRMGRSLTVGEMRVHNGGIQYINIWFIGLRSDARMVRFHDGRSGVTDETQAFRAAGSCCSPTGQPGKARDGDAVEGRLGRMRSKDLRFSSRPPSNHAPRTVATPRPFVGGSPVDRVPQHRLSDPFDGSGAVRSGVSNGPRDPLLRNFSDWPHRERSTIDFISLEINCWPNI